MRMRAPRATLTVTCANGGRGIRTPKSLRTPVFKTGALAILPALPDRKITGHATGRNEDAVSARRGESIRAGVTSARMATMSVLITERVLHVRDNPGANTYLPERRIAVMREDGITRRELLARGLGVVAGISAIPTAVSALSAATRPAQPSDLEIALKAAAWIRRSGVET
jgi:hypothetical protein